MGNAKSLSLAEAREIVDQMEEEEGLFSGDEVTVEELQVAKETYFDDEHFDDDVDAKTSKLKQPLLNREDVTSVERPVGAGSSVDTNNLRANIKTKHQGTIPRRPEGEGPGSFDSNERVTIQVSPGTGEDVPVEMFGLTPPSTLGHANLMKPRTAPAPGGRISGVVKSAFVTGDKETSGRAPFVRDSFGPRKSRSSTSSIPPVSDITTSLHRERGERLNREPGSAAAPHGRFSARTAQKQFRSAGAKHKQSRENLIRGSRGVRIEDEEDDDERVFDHNSHSGSEESVYANLSLNLNPNAPLPAPPPALGANLVDLLHGEGSGKQRSLLVESGQSGQQSAGQRSFALESGQLTDDGRKKMSNIMANVRTNTDSFRNGSRGRDGIAAGDEDEDDDRDPVNWTLVWLALAGVGLLIVIGAVVIVMCCCKNKADADDDDGNDENEGGNNGNKKNAKTTGKSAFLEDWRPLNVRLRGSVARQSAASRAAASTLSSANEGVPMVDYDFKRVSGGES
ncbi:unnamed protein product [Amoebophrya sp. A120]|nr:unnamed protein product [Amoebophrya sp. A120]|eukprot:GSA120T00018599001.1